MIPKDCKRLAEVDFPITKVSQHAAWEKSIRHGHPSTLHQSLARWPLPSSPASLLCAEERRMAKDRHDLLLPLRRDKLRQQSATPRADL